MNDLGWYADSGTSYHVTDNAGNIWQKAKYNGNETFTVGNGNKLNIGRIGDSYLHTYVDKVLVLKNMLHVPDIKKNLLSVSQLTVCNDIFV